jgi:chemotaxis protein CheD
LTVENAAGHVVKVGVAEFRVGQAPARMMTLALGSCLGIVLHDPVAGVGALAHAMHPRRERVKNNANRAKFVDSVIPVLVSRMVRWGASRERVTAKLFGGARMFDALKGCPGILQIGDENILSAREVLGGLGIPVTAESVGGTCGRTIVFDLSDGSVSVRYVDGVEEMR